MQPDNNKHKLFSKEELFKLIDEKKSLPTDADDFDKEAMEGLSMLTNRKKVDGLNNSIDDIVLLEKKNANKKRSIYIFSAAASVILIIGIFFLLKNNSFEKQDKVLAENTKTTNETKQDESPKAALTETVADERERTETKSNGPVTTGSAEASGKGKEGKKLENEVVTEQNKNISNGGAMAVPPMTPTEKKVSNAENYKSPANEEPAADNDSRNAGGKDFKTKTTQEEEKQGKREEAKKQVAKLEDKEKDKTKYRANAVSNTTPSSGAVAIDDSKNKAGDDSNQNQLDQTTTVTSNNNAVPLKEAEEKTVADKKAELHEQKTKPDSTVTDMLAGYSYSTNKPDRAAAGGVTSELQKSQQQSPAQTQSNAGYYHAPTPEFVGGETTIQDYIKKNLKISNPNKTGTIDVKFLVKKDGSIDTTSIKIIKSIKDCAACSQDVINLIKGMPKLKPNTSTGKETENFQMLSVPYAAGPNTK